MAAGAAVQPSSAASAAQQPIARGIAHAEVLCIRGEALHQSGRLARGNPDGMCDDGGIEGEQLCARRGRAKDAAGRGDVEAAGVMARRDSVAEPACDLHTENEGMEEFRP